jgi:histidine triad (HIT) family protein
MKEETVFEKIIQGKLPCEKVYEDEKIIAIKDIHPAAPVHILIMPKKNFKNLQHLPKEDVNLIGEIVLVAQQLAKKIGIENNYRLTTNNGPEAGQTIYHLHFHLLGGRTFGLLG